MYVYIIGLSILSVLKLIFILHHRQAFERRLGRSLFCCVGKRTGIGTLLCSLNNIIFEQANHQRLAAAAQAADDRCPGLLRSLQ